VLCRLMPAGVPNLSFRCTNIHRHPAPRDAFHSRWPRLWVEYSVAFCQDAIGCSTTKHRAAADAEARSVAVRPKRNTSNRHPGPKGLYPYLLRGRRSTGDQWWLLTSRLPLRRIFLYRVAIIDWATPAMVLSPAVSHTLTAGFCVEALARPRKESRAPSPRFGKPASSIYRSGGALHTARVHPELGNYGIAISMDGRVRATTTSSSSACGGP